LATSTFVWRGRRGTSGTGLGLVARLVAVRRRGTLRGSRGTWRRPPSFHVAGVALGDNHLRLAWPAWHLATSTFVLHGRRGASGTGLAWWSAWSPLVARDAAALCVAGMALGDIHLRLVWQAWRFWHWAGSGGALGRR